ncbi:unnamed protein product [Sphagnum compactum]
MREVEPEWRLIQRSTGKAPTLPFHLSPGSSVSLLRVRFAMRAFDTLSTVRMTNIALRSENTEGYLALEYPLLRQRVGSLAEANGPPPSYFGLPPAYRAGMPSPGPWGPASTPAPGANGILKGEGKYNILKDIFHIMQILMAGKSPSGLEMVLKGLDIQPEISTLDSSGFGCPHTVLFCWLQKCFELTSSLAAPQLDFGIAICSQSKDEDTGLAEMDTTEAAPVARDCTYINKMGSL